jgi:hypothetical protein
MNYAARILTIGLTGLAISISACSQEKDYAKNFDTPNVAPLCFYDVTTYDKGVFTGIGWAADKEDGAPLKKIIVYVDGKAVGEAKYYADRSDVVTMYKNERWLKSGWRVVEKIPLEKGPHSSMALAYDSNDALKVTVRDFKVE